MDENQPAYDPGPDIKYQFTGRMRVGLITYPDGDEELCGTFLEPRHGIPDRDLDGVTRQRRRMARRKGRRFRRRPGGIIVSLRSRRSAVTRLRRKARAGGLNIMLTLTTREPMTEIKEIRGHLTRFIRLVRAELGRGWRLVYVLELTQAGALHVHAGVKGWQPVGTLRRLWYKALGGTGLETGKDTPGQVDLQSRQYSPRHLANYLAKYLQKNPVRAQRGWYYGTSQNITIDRTEFNIEGADEWQCIAKALKLLKGALGGFWRSGDGMTGPLVWACTAEARAG